MGEDMIDLDIDVAEALSARGPALDSLMHQAAALRDVGLQSAGRPGQITWSRKVFVPVTTLCRDRCHYCIFVDTPGKLHRKGAPVYLSEDQVLAIAQQGARLGCNEALLTLGDRPETRWPIARQWLDEHGFASTIDYVEHLARLITRETGLLAHPNPGVMSVEELTRLRRVAPSMGMMLETTSTRLFTEPGQAHYGSPDKDPAVRLKTLTDAGRLRVPFTTGILVGIGETIAERADSLLALRSLADEYGHLQEVIVQNFRSKPATAMRGVRDVETETYLAAVAVARLVLGPDMRIQAPPNLTDPDELTQLVAAGIDDWGGVSPLTADHVNPERPWPQVTELARATASAGFNLVERLTVHPEYVRDRAVWIDPALHQSVEALADDSGLAASRDFAAPTDRPRALLPIVTGSSGRPRGGDAPVSDDELLDQAAHDPASLGLGELTRLLEFDAEYLDRLAAVADDLRRSVVGATTTLVLNRNLGSDQVTDSETVAAVAADAWELGASELCIQGTAPPDTAVDVYERIAAAVKAVVPDIHLHAFRPADVIDGARRTGRTLTEQLTALRAAGVDTVPGTGVKILDDRIRRARFAADIPVDQWIESITAAHQAGLRSTSVMFYGHGETATDRARHLLKLRDLQRATGGFTELVPMALPDAELRDHLVVHAVARIALHGSIPHIQAAWTRLGVAGAIQVLRAGADDLGGTLFDGRVVPEAGVEHGRELSVDTAHEIARGLGRQLRIRSTTYAEPPQRNAP